MPLNKLAGDAGTDDGERRTKLVWQNFRIKAVDPQRDCSESWR